MQYTSFPVLQIYGHQKTATSRYILHYHAMPCIIVQY